MMEDKIREIVEAMGFSFSIGDIYHLNQWLQQPEQLPAVLYVMPINGGGEITVSGMLKKNIEPLLFFLDHEGIDPEGEDTNTIGRLSRYRCSGSSQLFYNLAFEPLQFFL